MTTFQNGPAKDVTLELKRIPHFLRVTRNTKLEFDALDLLEDSPRADETLIAYQLADQPLRGMIDGAKYRGPFVSAWYKLVDPQPSDAQMRDTVSWRKWCQERAALDASQGKSQTGDTNPTTP